MGSPRFADASTRRSTASTPPRPAAAGRAVHEAQRRALVQAPGEARARPPRPSDAGGSQPRQQHPNLRPGEQRAALHHRARARAARLDPNRAAQKLAARAEPAAGRGWEAPILRRPAARFSPPARVGPHRAGARPRCAARGAEAQRSRVLPSIAEGRFGLVSSPSHLPLPAQRMSEVR